MTASKNLNNSMISEEIVKEVGNQARHAVTEESEPQLQLDAEAGTASRLELALPENSQQVSSESLNSIQLKAEAAKESIQRAADASKRTVDRADLIIKKTSDDIRKTFSEISEETSSFAHAKAEDIRRFALMAIEWIMTKSRMAKETVVLNALSAKRSVVSTGHLAAIKATQTADSISESIYERKEKVKLGVRGFSQTLNQEVLSLTEPAPRPILSQFALPTEEEALAERQESLEERTIQTEEERNIRASVVTLEDVKEMGRNAEHVMTHEHEPEVEEEERGVVSHLSTDPKTQSTSIIRSSLKDSILMAKQDLKSSKVGRSENESSAPSIRSN